MPLDEMALRKPGFCDGPKVKLADGQEWTFPKPRFRVFPTEGEDGQITTAWQKTYGREIDRLLDIFIGCSEHTLGELFDMRFRAAGELLRRNYDLAIPQFAELLWFEEDNPTSIAMWEEIDAILMGVPRPGKPQPLDPSPGGSASA